jgi:hypothetical protein
LKIYILQEYDNVCLDKIKLTQIQFESGTMNGLYCMK